MSPVYAMLSIMGMTNVHTTIATLTAPKRKVSGEFLVDTGAGYTVIPYPMWKQLNLKPIKTQIFSLADGTTVTRPIGFAMVAVDGYEAPSPVVLGEKGDSALLGAITLENMGLLVDPFKRELRPMKLMLA